MSPHQKTATFKVTNPTERTQNVRLEWLELNAQSDGSYRPRTPLERQTYSAAPFLSLSPASFQLAPGECREIFIQLRPENSLSEGPERRSHLLFRFETDTANLRKAAANLSLDVARSVSVPVILRPSQAAASLWSNHAAIEDVRLRRQADGGLALDVQLNREGGQSIYGALNVEAALRPGSEPERIAQRENISLYTDSPRRLVSFDLGLRSLPESQLAITFAGRGEYSGTVFTRRLFTVRPPSVEPQPPIADPENSVRAQ